MSFQLPSNFGDLSSFFLLPASAVVAGATGGGSGTTPGQPPTQSLQNSLDQIPFANDGDVITRDHYNTLRSTLAQLAAAVDQTRLTPVQTLSFTPVLLPVVGSPAWRTTMGFVVGPQASNEAEGWMVLDLPNGTRIDTMTVRGRMPTNVGSWTVSLRRVELTGSAQRDVCTLDIQDAKTSQDGSFAVNVPAVTGDLTPAQAAELRQVDTARYGYLFHTAMADAGQSDAIELRLIQVTCTRG